MLIIIKKPNIGLFIHHVFSDGRLKYLVLMVSIKQVYITLFNLKSVNTHA